MHKDELPILKSAEKIQELKSAIVNIKVKISQIEKVLHPFEQQLRNAIADLLVLERELTVLYKQQKKAKKEKRLAQKRRGKNYKEVTSVTVITSKETELEKESLREKKRLYKEAMLQVHPDTFSLSDEAKATEATAKLIEVYKTGSLEELQAYCSYILSGNIETITSKSKSVNSTLYLQKELEELQKKLFKLKTSYTYKVLNEYENPMDFSDELKAYYNDRIFKLKKRTRTK